MKDTYELSVLLGGNDPDGYVNYNNIKQLLDTFGSIKCYLCVKFCEEGEDIDVLLDFPEWLVYGLKCTVFGKSYQRVGFVYRTEDGEDIDEIITTIEDSDRIVEATLYLNSNFGHLEYGVKYTRIEVPFNLKIL